MSIPPLPKRPADPKAAPPETLPPLVAYEDCSPEEQARRDEIFNRLHPIGSPVRLGISLAKTRAEYEALPVWQISKRRELKDVMAGLAAAARGSVSSRRY